MSEAWKKDLARELLRPKSKRFPRRRIFSPNVDRIWTMDLMDVHRYSKVNRNYKYILVILDIFSRFAMAHPLQWKTGEEVTAALRHIFTKTGRKPTRIWSEDGKEFFNSKVQGLLHKYGITLYSSFNEPKASIAERFIRTLRRKREMHYIITQSTVWYKALQGMIDEYNSEVHRSIGMSPNGALKPENYAKVYEMQYSKRSKIRQNKKSLLKIGDKVRISLHKRHFEKGSTANWSEEIFQIVEIMKDYKPIVYKLEDLAGEEIHGGFYREQLQKTDQEIHRIDRVIRKRKLADGTQESLVCWSGYSNKFDSRMPSDDVMRSRND